MSKARFSRTAKRQLGQFLTPPDVARKVVASLVLREQDRVLEPSFGEGAFLFAVIEKFLQIYSGTQRERLDQIFTENLYGVELDPELYSRFFELLKAKYDYAPDRHNLWNCDFFVWSDRNPKSEEANAVTACLPVFDHIIGNPPFGGSIDARFQDALDKLYGYRLGVKIKKETYSFFLVKSYDLLKVAGTFTFICSDTFMTINTMKGLRNLLMETGQVAVNNLEAFSEETTHPMVVINYRKTNRPASTIRLGAREVSREDVIKTKNLSWKVSSEYTKYFAGPTIGKYLIATSGMTIGKNELFLREIKEGQIEESYSFRFFDDPITLEREVSRARLGILSERMAAKIKEAEMKGGTRRNVKIIPLDSKVKISLPNSNYRYYNKANKNIVFAPPSWAIYWKDDGDAVYTFKKNGNWYLHGVGGKKFFGRSGITWSLIASRMHTKYLPEGYILDSGAPCAFLRPGVDGDELYLIMGWTLTTLCNSILKDVINHTRNIQGKDFERLPYPFWLSDQKRGQVINLARSMIDLVQQGKNYSFMSDEIAILEELFNYEETADFKKPTQTVDLIQPSLFT